MAADRPEKYPGRVVSESNSNDLRTKRRHFVRKANSRGPGG